VRSVAPRPALTEHAPAKVNLTLEVRGRRADGYHELESLVAFAQVGDTLALAPDELLGLRVRGPFAAAAGAGADNLVLKAARELASRIGGLALGRFSLVKRLPVAAGIGGGSSDAAAALRLLARLNCIDDADPRIADAARATGADVPVCLDPKPRVMRGIGEQLSPAVELALIPAVLVNPGIPVMTREVFAALGARGCDQPRNRIDGEFSGGADRLLAILRRRRNDLEAAAIRVAPVVATVLAELRAAPGCELARVSGSGGCCFGIFRSSGAAIAAARALRAARPGWWIRATALG
jgi:4-diphosphocytidyl-2-C-methyl-D-erythritol kinase